MNGQLDMLYKDQINNVTKIIDDQGFLLHKNGRTDTLFHVEMLCHQS